MARFLIVLGLAILVVGLLWPYLGKVGLGRLPGRRAERLARATSRVSCMPVGVAAQRPSEDGEMTEQARADSGIPSHV